jgi:hypothetical protein
MAKHRLRLAIEAGATEEELVSLLADDVVIYPPMLTQPVRGPENVARILLAAARTAGPIEYDHELNDGVQTFLIWKGTVGGFTLGAATILTDNPDGLISEIRVVMRPWPVVTLFRDAMHEELSAVIPAEAWELQPNRRGNGEPRQFTAISLDELKYSPDAVLHSPMLAKSVTGHDEVTEAVGLAHQVQSPSSYTTIIATTELVLELFDCDADGYPMEGLWLRKLNPAGEVTDLTVMLRPYPAVTVLRNRTRELARGSVIAGREYWELPVTAA